MGGVNGAEESTQSRDERIEVLAEESARTLAEWFVDAVDEIGSNVGGICTGMHADVAEAQAAWEDVCAERDRLTEDLARSRRDADFGWQFAEKQTEFVGEWVCLYTAQGAEAQRLLLRMRTAWLSARRRAARESEYAAEALALKDAEIALLRQSTGGTGTD